MTRDRDLKARLFGTVRCDVHGRILELDGQMHPLAEVLEELARLATEHADCRPKTAQPRRRRCA